MINPLLVCVAIVWVSIICIWITLAALRRSPIQKSLERLPVWLAIGTIETTALLLQNPSLLIAFLLASAFISIFEVLRLLPINNTSCLGLGGGVIVAWLSSNGSSALASLLILCNILLFFQNSMAQRASSFLISFSYNSILCLPFLLIASEHRFAFILIILTLVHIADISAGFAGKLNWGRPFPKLSQNKTWSGLVGSALFTTALSSALTKTVLSTSVKMAALLGIIVWAAAIVGDLIASKIKRLAKIKDFSRALGPHGGMADRTDSLTLVAPLTVIFSPFFSY